VKIMVMPNQMSDVEKRHRMAIMEAAISSSLSHPNIVQTYTYSMKPIKDLMSRESTSMSSDFEAEPGAGDKAETPGTGYVGILKNSDDPTRRQQLYQYSGFEVQLVLEYCNYGSLQRALQKGVFYDTMENGYHVPNYMAVLEIASDVAKGMLHLHTQNVVHSDLKVVYYFGVGRP
jgi:serine/threonine protein kinase